jgi:hypothetical protein
MYQRKELKNECSIKKIAIRKTNSFSTNKKKKKTIKNIQ